jgi:hypothetical protein
MEIKNEKMGSIGLVEAKIWPFGGRLGYKTQKCQQNSQKPSK